MPLINENIQEQLVELTEKLPPEITTMDTLYLIFIGIFLFLLSYVSNMLLKFLGLFFIGLAIIQLILVSGP